jgi:predicted nucleic acid-binding protein
MSARVFVDTNVLVYARDSSEGAKQRRAHEWLHALWVARAGRLSLQVLQEYYVTVTRKLKPGLDRATARTEIESLLAWDPVTVDAGVLELAFALEDAHRLSFWDSLVVAAARTAGCQLLLTEDLRDGTDFDGLEVVNPFRHAPADRL